MTQIIIFTVCSLVNVILSTMKTILTVRSTRTVASLINAITYGFYAIVVKQLASLDVTVTVVVTIATNLVGVYFSMWLMDKMKKDCLWKICATTKDKSIVKKIENFDIEYVMAPVKYKDETFYSIEIFSKNQKDSAIIKNILNEYSIKYNITEITKTL